MGHKSCNAGWIANLVNKFRRKHPSDPFQSMMRELRKRTRNNGSRMPHSLRFVWIAENGGSPHVVELCHVIVELEQHGIDRNTLDFAYQYLHSFPQDEQIRNVSKLPRKWAAIVIAGVHERYGMPAVSSKNEDSEVFYYHNSPDDITVEEASFDEFMAHAGAEKAQ